MVDLQRKGGGPVSDVVGELARVSEAFEKPTLTLLEGRLAQVVLAVFRSAFGQDNTEVPIDRLHTQVEAYLDELRFAGAADLPKERTGRQWCALWRKGQWLQQDVSDDGDEVYTLTSHAIEALDLVRNLTRERAGISESRINMILKEVRDWAMTVNPDRDARIRDYDERITRLQRERDRIADGGPLDSLTDDKMLDGWDNLLQLVRSLPVDFKRVEEAVQSMHREVIADFRNEDRPIAEVIDDYLVKSDELMTMTRQGQAFDGALVLLRDERQLSDLRDDLDVLLAHPVTPDILDPEDTRDVRSTVLMIQRGLDDVLGQRARLTSTLRDHIVHHDVDRDRKSADLLRQVNQHLMLWMQTANQKSRVPVHLLPAKITVGHLQQRFYDPANENPPPALEQVVDDTVAMTLEQIREQGGPSLDDLRARLVRLLGADATDTHGTAADFFNDLPTSLRRPVEILGVLHLMSRATELDETTGHELFTTYDPTGGVRVYRAPRVVLSHDQAAALSEGGPQ